MSTRFSTVNLIARFVVLVFPLLLSSCSTVHLQPLPNGPADLEAELRSSVQHLAENIGERHLWKPAKLEEAAVWIETELQRGGLRVYRQTYRAGGPAYHVESQLVRNLVVEIPGTTRPKEILVIGAHYDSRVGMSHWHSHGPARPDLAGTQGADDNATGVAGLLASAQHFAQNPQERTLRFVAFVNEEPPFFTKKAMGSYVYARECFENGDRIVGMLSLEMLGRWSRKDRPNPKDGIDPRCKAPSRKRSLLYTIFAPVFSLPARPNYVAFLGNCSSSAFTKEAARAFNASGIIEARDSSVPVDILPAKVAWSDDWAFWHFGYEACSVTDTAFLRNDDYHECSDTVDRIDYPEMAAVVQVLKGTITRLANAR